MLALEGETMNIERRNQIRSVLRDNLLGKENQHKVQLIIDKLGITQSTIKTWTAPNGNGIPVTDDLPDLCDILGITIYDLYGIKNPTDLTDEETDLIKNYRSQSEHKATVNKIYGMK